MKEHALALDDKKPVKLAGLRVLIVEDECVLANDLAQCLEEHGAEVVGPIETVGKAIHLVKAKSNIDLAVLDVDVNGVSALTLAKMLRERGLPFIFATGFEPSLIPDEFRDIACWQKPLDCNGIVKSLDILSHNSYRLCGKSA